MTAPIEDPTGTAGKTFTQPEVDAIVRDRLKRERDATATKYADYDTLKAAAADADKTKTQLDKVLEKLTAAEERTGKLEAANLRSEVTGSKLKGLPASITKHLQGKTKEELEAHADELLADWKEAGGKVGDETDPSAATAPPATRGRPREALHSGAPLTPATPEETNPLKLAALVPRN